MKNKLILSLGFITLFCVIIVGCFDNGTQVDNDSNQDPGNSDVTNSSEENLSSVENLSSINTISSNETSSEDVTSSEVVISSATSSEEISSSLVISSSEIVSSSIEISSSSLEEPFNPSITYDELVDDRDGTTYKTVIIGTQEWMAENINYVDYAHPTRKDFVYCYDNRNSNCATYGRLYETSEYWVCPSGWRTPSNTDWSTLIEFVKSDSQSDNVGKLLKSNTSHWSEDARGTDNYGFSAIPGGYKSVSGGYSNIEYGAFFWSSSQNSNWEHYSVEFSTSDYLSEKWQIYDNAYSIRCMRGVAPSVGG